MFRAVVGRGLWLLLPALVLLKLTGPGLWAMTVTAVIAHIGFRVDGFVVVGDSLALGSAAYIRLFFFFFFARPIFYVRPSCLSAS